MGCEIGRSLSQIDLAGKTELLLPLEYKRSIASRCREGQARYPLSAPAIFVNREALWVRDVAHATCFDVHEQTFQPVAIEASLLVEMTQQVLAAR